MKFNDETRSIFNSLIVGAMSAKDMSFYIEVGLVEKSDFEKLVKLSEHSELKNIQMHIQTNNVIALKRLFKSDKDTRAIYKLLMY